MSGGSHRRRRSYSRFAAANFTTLAHLSVSRRQSWPNSSALARSAAVPDVPTLGETVQGYEVSGWTGIGVPAGTPAAIVATLNREINAGLADARIAARLAEVGGRPIVVNAEEFGQLWRRDTDKWAKVVKFAAAKRE